MRRISRMTTFHLLQPCRVLVIADNWKVRARRARGGDMLKQLACVATILVLAVPGAALAQKKYGPGVSDTEIKIGSTAPLSGPVSAFSAIGNAAAGYFKKINDEGGINGRKINFLLMDDAFSPPRTVEQVRKLVEQEQVLTIFGLVGTGTNTVVQKYLASQKVPQLFAATGATKWG